MMESPVKLIVGDTIYQGWEKVEIARSIYTLAGSFNLTLSPAWKSVPSSFTLNGGEECQLLIDKTPIITGFIDKIDEETESSRHDMQVRGRDRTADLVDCSYLSVPRCWENIQFETLLKKYLSPYKIPYKILADTGHAFPTWGIGEESIFDNLVKAASLRGLLLTSSGLGELIVTKPASTPTSICIDDHSGFISARKCIDFSERYSHYEVRIQNYQAIKTGDAHLKIIAQSKDHGVKRYRPLLIPQDGEVRSEVAKKRVNWERDLRISRSNRFIIKIPGWFNPTGDLWQVNQVIHASISSIRAFGKYLITGVRFLLDNDGLKTCLECEGVHGADIDPTLESREYNVKRLVEEEISSHGVHSQ